MAQRITIGLTSGGEGSALLGYYFEEADGGYNLYAPTIPPTQKNTQLLTPENPSCTFQVAGHHDPFTVSITRFPVAIIDGTWTDTSEGRLNYVPGSGTFQAQAGGTGPVEEEAAAASAK